MRYVIQIFVMLFDIVLIFASAQAIYDGWRNPGNWIIVGLMFFAWHKLSGFRAWKPSSIRAFMTNAKKMGL
jgi:hypothetical protein